MGAPPSALSSYHSLMHTCISLLCKMTRSPGVVCGDTARCVGQQCRSVWGQSRWSDLIGSMRVHRELICMDDGVDQSGWVLRGVLKCVTRPGLYGNGKLKVPSWVFVETV